MIRLGRKRIKSPSAVLRGYELYLRLFKRAWVLFAAFSAPAMAQLPVPCVGGACAPAGGPSVWVTSGQAQAPVVTAGNMTINQQSDRATLNWQTFNIGTGNSVEFKQPSADSVALNRVWDPASNPSSILGHLIANGQVYLINRNGILFGPHAQIDVHGLVASTLDIDNGVFKLGLLSAIDNTSSSVHRAAFQGDGRVVVLDKDGNPLHFAVDQSGKPARFKVDDSGAPIRDGNGLLIPDPEGSYIQDPNGAELNVKVEIDKGAKLTTDSGGRIMVLGQNVENHGDITTPDGQAILAAGNKVYLMADSVVRGLRVEVDANTVDNGTLQAYLQGQSTNLPMGTVTNDGTVSTPRGNATLIGLAVNQNGIVSATSALNENGSIRLLARDGGPGGPFFDLESGTQLVKNMTANRAGRVVLGDNSLTQVILDAEKAADTAVDEQPITPSTVDIMGQDIELQKNSEILAPSGQVSLTALQSPKNDTVSGNVTPRSDSATVHMAAGSSIDVSGTNITLPMDRNQITVDLRGNELKDSPLQRNGVLYAQTVTVDLHQVDQNGKIPIADVSGAVANIRRTLAERSTSGGTVNISSTGSANVDKGSTIDVSGGTVTYDSGYLNPTYLVSDNRIYDINTADPNRHYDAVLGSYTKDHTKWGVTETWTLNAGMKGIYQPGYVEGKDAGSVQFKAYTMDLQGSLVGHTQAGPFQRQDYNSPLGGLLVIGDPTGGNLSDGTTSNYFAPNVTLGTAADLARIQQSTPFGKDDLALTTDYMASGGFTRTAIYSNGRVYLVSDINLAAGGSLSLTSQDIEVGANIRAPAGDISLSTRLVNDQVKLLSDSTPKLDIGDGVTLDTSGLWANDLPAEKGGVANPDLTAPALVNGGNISVNLAKGGDLAIGDAVTMDASAGGWLQSSGTLTAGKGGNISIAVEPNTNTNNPSSVTVGGNLQLRSYALHQGGTLSLAFPQVTIQGDQSAASIAAQQGLWASGQSTLPSDAQKTALVASVLDAYQQTTTNGKYTPADPVVARLLTGLKTQLDQAASTAARQTLASDAVDRVRNPFQAPSYLFGKGGFSGFQVTATAGDLQVADGATIQPRMENLVPASSFQQHPSGSNLMDFTSIQVLPDWLRQGTNLSLAVDYPSSVQVMPDLVIGAGSAITLDPQTQVNLTSAGRIDVLGTIDSPAGTIQIVHSDPTRDFNFNRVVYLGADSQLLARGTAVLHPNGLGLKTGEVLDGGSVSLIAKGGIVDMARGTVIDVTGTAQPLDIVTSPDTLAGVNNQVTRKVIASNAGEINVTATEGMRLDGTFKAQGGQGEGAAGGSLTVSLNTSAREGSFPSDPTSAFSQHNGQRDIIIIQDPVSTRSGSADGSQGQPDTASFDGTASLSVSPLTDSGVDSLTLFSSSKITFKDSVDLRLGRSIRLDAPVIDSATGAATDKVVLDAPYIGVGPSDVRTASGVSTDGEAMLQIGNSAASLVDLIGDTRLDGFSATDINSRGDIRLRGLLDEFITNTNPVRSGFYAAGALTLQADQVYPTTLSQFILSSRDTQLGAGTDAQQIRYGTITILPGDTSAPPPASSAFGALTLQASAIEQDGMLKAPLGSITMQATPRFVTDPGTGAQTQVAGTGLLTLNGVTSTAADQQQTLFGNTVAGTEWAYAGIQIYNSKIVPPQFSPAHQISLQGDQVNVSPQAVVDMSGGGSALGYEFLPGPGGSQDVLTAGVAQAENTYAIVPWLKDSYAPYDTQISSGWNLKPGDSVDLLAGAAGLAPGQYALLPARYAMLPGAYLVTAVSGYQDIQAGQRASLVDGTSVVPGRFSVANTNIHDARTSGFAIRPGSFALQRSEYQQTRFSDFLVKQTALDNVPLPRLPQDAGTLTVNADQAITLQGTLKGDAATGGRGANVDIVASDISVVNNASDSAEGVKVVAGDLSRLGAESILIGGTRTDQGGATDISVGAKQVTVGSGAVLSAPEIILAATGTKDGSGNAMGGVTLKSGSEIHGTGTVTGQQQNIVIGRNSGVDDQGNAITPIAGDGALLRVSAGDQVALDRINSSGSTGVLDIQSGAVVAADSSMILDSSVRSQVDGSIDIVGGSLTLASDRISLGSAPAGTPGLVLTGDEINTLAPRDLILSSRSTLDLYGDLTFGVDNNNQVLLNSLTIDSAGLAGYDASGESNIAANHIQLANPNNSAFSAPANPDVTPTPGTGTLTLAAFSDSNASGSAADVTAESGQVVLGQGGYQVQGYSDVTITADNEITGSGSGVLTTPANMQLSTPNITGEAGADTRLNIGQALNMVNSTAGTPAAAPATTGLGAQFSAQAQTIDLATSITLPSGSVDLHAAGDLTVTDGAQVNVAGETRTMADVPLGAWGGTVALNSDTGSVSVAGGATIDVSGASPGGSAGGADAGTLQITAPGDGSAGSGIVDLQGTVLADVQSGYKGGSFSLDADALKASPGANAFSDLNAELNKGGFNEARSIRLRSGDIIVDGGADAAVKAHQVNLTTDQGGIRVAGLIDASGQQGGQVQLNARDDMTVDGAGHIDARALGAGEQGGNVKLATSRGRLAIQAGAVIDVSGTAADGSTATNSGTVTLRTPQARIAQAADANGNPLLDGQGNPVIAMGADGSPVYLFTDPNGQVVTTMANGGAAPVDTQGNPVIDPGANDTVAITALEGTIKGASQTTVEAFRTYLEGDGSLISSEVSAVSSNPRYQDAVNFMSHTPAMLAALGKSNDSSLRIVPGLEIISSGDLSLDGNWDLSTWRFGTDQTPGMLTLRAAGDLSMNKSLSDGFAAQDTLQSGDSWSYYLVGGADISSADVSAMLPSAALADGKGNVVIGSGQHVRTGTGDINIFAGNDVKLADQTSVIYTAGNPAYPSANVPRSTIKENWPNGGGDITLRAQNDVVGAVSNQLITSWLWRQGGETSGFFFKTAVPVQWAVDIGQFQENVGALGGGNVTVSAGRDITNFSAVIPTTGRQMSPGYDRSQIQVWGSGDLAVSAGRDITGGVYMVGDGNGLIKAGRDLTAGGTASQPLETVLALGSGTLGVETGGAATIATVVQPTLVPQPISGLSSPLKDYLTYFLTNSSDTAVNLTALGGDITLQRYTSDRLTNFYSGLSGGNGSGSMQIYPPALNAYALHGSITVGQAITLLPSASGTLSLIADQNVNVQNVYVSDADPGLLPTINNPTGNMAPVQAILENGHAATALHLGDPIPIYITAQNGDIVTHGLLAFAKQARLTAGRDINLLKLAGQNVGAADVTVVQAGRDIRFTTIQSVTAEKIEVGGTGRLDVLAGRNMDLGASGGITTVGNLKNPALTGSGADVTVLVGVKSKPDYQAFVDKYFASGPQYADDVTTYMRNITGDQTLTPDQALAEFLKLPVLEQRPVIITAFFNELKLSGRAAVTTQDYSRGFDAIATLFPDGGTYQGDLSMFQSRIYTLDGGDINLLVPGGLVNEGVAGSTSVSKTPSELGIVAQRAGSVRTFSSGDFTVNQSRVFTLAGGDITMWSSNGNIDAGRGAKSAISAPQPNIVFDASGNAQIDFSGAVSGSGIRAIITDSNISPGDVDLIAPKGVVNAGDAGIGSAGHITIPGQVVGGANIQAGSITVAPTVDTGALATGLSGVSNITSGVTKSTEDTVNSMASTQVPSTPLADAALSYLEVVVTKLGNEPVSGGN